MKSEKKILIAFILNLTFSVFEFFGGIFTGSVAIVSDSIHDMGDAASIGISHFLEKKSKRPPDNRYTYGYGRYSVLGSVITTMILLLGSSAVIFNAVIRIIYPAEINCSGMIIFAIFGFSINLIAAIFTHGGHSMNQKAVNLHMIEDVLGWIVVLVGAVVMNYTALYFIDPIISIGVAVFILISAVKNLTETLDLFLEKTPRGLNIDEIKEQIVRIDGVIDVRNIHIFSIDGEENYADMHIVTTGNFPEIKKTIREKLYEYGIFHTTLEPESEDECCNEKNCYDKLKKHPPHHHHH